MGTKKGIRVGKGKGEGGKVGSYKKKDTARKGKIGRWKEKKKMVGKENKVRWQAN